MIKKNHSLSNQILDPSLHRNISLNKRPKCHATRRDEELESTISYREAFLSNVTMLKANMEKMFD